MIEDKKLTVDENERLAQYEAVKRSVHDNVNVGIAQQAAAGQDSARLAQLGEHLQEQAVRDVVATERDVATTRVAARGSQFLDYLFYLIYGVIALQILFDLLGARKANAISQFINAVSSPLLAPFRNLFPDPAAGRFQFRISYLMAIVVYILLHLAINGLFRLIAHRKTEI